MRVICLVPLFAMLSALHALGADAVTFSENIAPIIYINCVTCHRSGEAAPFSLISYDDVKKRGALIATVTQSRYMPPWHAAHGYGDFAGERRLSDAEIAAIGEWVRQGMPEGNPARAPKLPQFPDGWHLGQPDLVLEMPAGFDLPATGPDVFRNFVIPTGLKEDKWVRAVEFRPSARKAVHHALFAYIPGGAMSKQDGVDGRPGFGGMGTVGVVPGQGNSGSLGGWAVGGTPAMAPDGTATLLPKGSDFLLQAHFHPTGKPETEKSVIGIYFADKAPEKDLVNLQLPALFGFGAGIDIPAGEKNYTIRDSYTLPTDIRVYSAIAHAHYVGKEMKVSATLPDGSTKPLIWIPDWDFNWQDVYNYKEPFILPKGTHIDATIGYDNSADNPRNPSNPPKRVLWGEQSFDEMGTVGLRVEILNRQDEPTFLQAINERTRSAIQKGAQDGTARRYLLSQAPPQQIKVFDRQGKVLNSLGEPGIYSQAAFSPDGTRVAAVRTDRSNGKTDVWVFDIATGKGMDLTQGISPGEGKASPVWSPDGTQIVWVSTAGSASAIYRKAADGSGSEELIYKHTPGPAIAITDWSTDGTLCFWAGKVVYTLPLNGDRKATQVLGGNFNARGGRFSPDGHLLAWNTDEPGPGRFQVYVGPVPGPSKESKASQVSREPAIGGIFWRQDGKELYFLSSPEQALMAVDVTTDSEVHSGTPKLLFRLPNPTQAPAQLSNVASRDGQRFVFVAQVIAGAR